MTALSETVSMKRWQACLLMGMTGFAFGIILAKAAAVVGL